MADLIDRQKAIDAAIEAADDWDGGCNIGRQKRIEKYIRQLPSAEPQERMVGTDLISRQAAIDALGERPMVWTDNDIYSLGQRNQYDFDRLALELVPSAEPQIVRCKDCKHRDPEDKKCDCGHDIRWQLPRRDDWYWAEAERRTDG